MRMRRCFCITRIHSGWCVRRVTRRVGGRQARNTPTMIWSVVTMCGMVRRGWRGVCRVGLRWRWIVRVIGRGFCLIVAGCFLIVMMRWCRVM
jgi:hypothetical protein